MIDLFCLFFALEVSPGFAPLGDPDAEAAVNVWEQRLCGDPSGLPSGLVGIEPRAAAPSREQHGPVTPPAGGLRLEGEQTLQRVASARSS